MADSSRSGIVTPEAVVLEFETAGIASRLLAGFIDLALQGAVLFGIFTFVGFVAGLAGAAGGVAAALLFVLVFVDLFGYPVACETLWRGRTVGKAAMGLRVVTTEGAPVRFRHAAIRAILALVDWYAFSGLVGITSMLLTKRDQRLGDLVAGTLVLRERTAAGASKAVHFAPPPGLESYTSTLSAAGIGHEEYGSVRSFLLRAATLPPAVRADLASQLAYPLIERMRTTPPPGVPPELFLVCVAAAYQRRMSRPTGPVGSTFASVWAGLPE